MTARELLAMKIRRSRLSATVVLRIKAFYGTSENAVKTQIWIAVSMYVLVAIVRKRLGMEASIYQILQIFSLRKPCTLCQE